MPKNRKGYLLPADVPADNMIGDSDMRKEMKKLREEVSELRNMVNLLLGLIMEEEEVIGPEDRVSAEVNEIYN